MRRIGRGTFLVGLAVVTFVFWAVGTAYVLLWADPDSILRSCSVGQHGVVQSCTSADAVGVLLPWAVGFLGIVGGFLLIRHRRLASLRSAYNWPQ